VRTWKRWLWNLVRDSDLRDDSGAYFRIAEDRAIMLPLLEMSGTKHACHIATPLMEYNQRGCYSSDELGAASKNLQILRRRLPYAQLQQPYAQLQQPYTQLQQPYARLQRV
jgi:hypothetical protein